MAKTTRKKKETTPVSEPVIKQQPVDNGHLVLEAQVAAVLIPTPGVLITEKPVEQPATDQPPAPQPPAQPVVTQEIVTARMKTELTKLGYQDKLQKFTDLKVTEDNMALVQQECKNMRGFLRAMDSIKTAGKKPALDRCRMWDMAYNELSELLETELGKKQSKLNDIAQEQARKADIARKEEQRKSDIRTAIDNFILQQSQAIAAAKGDTELVRIQKFIGSAKANVGRYQEFLPDLIARCNELNPLINTQKEAIRELRELEEKRKEAEKAGDDATLIAIEDKKEQLNATIDEQKVLVQETAINQATKTTDVITAEPIISTVKARRTKWKIELVNDKKSIQKALDAGLLDVSINKEKGDVLINTIKDLGQLKDVKEFFSNGCRLYLEELF